MAYHLVRAIRHAGGKKVQLYARSSQKARLIADKFGVSLVTDLASVKPDADLYVLAVKDDALSSAASAFPFKDRLVVHTSGATPMEVLDPASSRKGVFYPLQTFTFGRDIDFQGVPVCLEASGWEDLDLLRGLARELSGNAWVVISVQRLHLHLAAVFAANFTHHMYAIASHILDGQGIPFGILGPLIQEIIAIAMILAWAKPPLSLYGTLGIILVAYFAVYLPFAVRTTNSTLQQVHDSLEEAACASGAGIWPACVISFCRSLARE